jgi:hypothetical protein
MSTALKALRLGQKNVRSANPNFNGVITAVLVPQDTARLTFAANVKVFTGDAGQPFVEFTPCSDYGIPKVFGNVDDVVTWLKGAYLDISDLSFTIADFDTVTKKFVPPTDPIKDATSKKAQFTKLRDGMTDNIAAVNAKVAAAVASGWDLPTAHPALQANYAEYVAQQTATNAINAFYVAEIARYNAIINPA